MNKQEKVAVKNQKQNLTFRKFKLLDEIVDILEQKL